MTHPDILYAERHGYPAGAIEVSDCPLCGDTMYPGNILCKNCIPVTCVICKDDFPADTVQNSICEDCVKEAANTREKAVAYLKHLDCDVAICEATEFIADIMDLGKLFFAETQKMLAAEVHDYHLQMPLFNTVTKAEIDAAIKGGLRDFALSDTGHFAEWLATA